jgi:hypothetical protein
MNQTTIIAAYACWIPAMAAIFWWKGPRLSVPIALFAGFLLLPRVSCEEILPVVGSWINKLTVSGLALLVGILISDGRRLLKARPSLLDIPMFAFVLLPLVSFGLNEFDEPRIGLRQVWINFAGWSLPYLAGRLYFGDRDGPSRLCKAITIAGLASLPIFAFEMVMGPSYYLAKLVYGIDPYDNMVFRLGGWRPEGFQTSGLEVGTWLSLASTVAAWSWMRGGWPSHPGLAWLPPAALMVATVAIRGVYGYISLAIGLMTSVLSNLLKTRFLIALLALLPPLYIGVRTSGVWDGRVLVELSEKAGRADTVAYRIRAENAYLEKVFDHGIWFGFGGKNSDIYDYWAKAHLWPDGWWIHQLRTGGLVGLSAALLALFLYPVGLGLALPAGKSRRSSPGALAWGLALFIVLHMIDCLHNMNYLTATPMIGGSLVSLFRGRRTNRLDVPPIPPPGIRSASPPPMALLVTITVLALCEILGSVPRTSTPLPAPVSPEPLTPAVDPRKPR